MGRRWILFALLGAGALGFGACSELKEAAPGEQDAGADDASDDIAEAAPDASGDAETDGPLPDSPPDSECKEPWKLATKTNAGCAPRRVALVEAGTLFVAYVSIARTSNGRVGVLYNFADVEQDDLHLSHFVESAAWPPTFKKAVLSKGFAEHVAIRGRVLAGSGDVFHVVEHEYADDGPGDVVYIRLANGQTPFTQPEQISAGVPRNASLSAAIGPSGEIIAGWYVPGTTGDGGVPGRFATSLRPANGSFTPPVVVESDVVDSAGGVGQSALRMDTAGATHLLLYHSRSSFGGSPRYYSSSGTGFAPRKSLENAADQDGFVGYSPAIGLFGARKFAAYFARPSGTTKAQLHLASWTLQNEEPSLQIVEQNIPAPDPKLPTYAAAMAVDRWGLVHLAILLPGPSSTAGVLEYKRQTRQAGQVGWLTDVVDDDVLSDTSQAFVDLLVDDRGRPHIAYRSGKDGNVYYATRTDR
jgi:hypothetical protein